jgi:hypothetical protein
MHVATGLTIKFLFSFLLITAILHFINFCCYGSQEAGSSSGGQAAPLGLPNVGGVFVVLLGGMGVACLIAAVEFLWESKNTAKEDGVCIDVPRMLKRWPCLGWA